MTILWMLCHFIPLIGTYEEHYYRLWITDHLRSSKQNGKDFSTSSRKILKGPTENQNGSRVADFKRNDCIHVSMSYSVIWEGIALQFNVFVRDIDNRYQQAALFTTLTNFQKYDWWQRHWSVEIVVFAKWKRDMDTINNEDWKSKRRNRLRSS